jgi:hypothetical protein
MKIDRDQLALLVACVPVALAAGFLAFAPSDGANIGGGILLMLSLPIAAAVYLLLRPRDPANRRQWRQPRDW